VMVNNSIITTKTKESLRFVVLVELLTITVVNFLLFCCIGRIVDHHCCKLSFVLL
jgi:hypothetical protein